MRKNKLFYFIITSIFLLSGCAIILQPGRRSDIEKIKSLQEELRGLRDTKSILQERLAREIKDKQVRIKMAEKGLVITFVAEVLFDSGKAVLKKNSFPILNKVVRVLKEEVPANDIGIEGHTDNVPIKYSPWKDNWELSLHRAYSVLKYLEAEGINPQRLSASGYGEHRPVASNDNSKGRQLNRRVEIVILPKTVKRIEKEPIEKENEFEEELK